MLYVVALSLDTDTRTNAVAACVNKIADNNVKIFGNYGVADLYGEIAGNGCFKACVKSIVELIVVAVISCKLLSGRQSTYQLERYRLADEVVGNVIVTGAVFISGVIFS